MLKASFETICLSFSLAVKSQSYPLRHLLTASCFFVEVLVSLTVIAPHKHLPGNSNGLLFLPLFEKSTDTTCGITSPAL